LPSKLSVTEDEVISMNRRLAAPDYSLNAPLRIDDDGEWQDWLVDETDSQEIQLAGRQEISKRRKLLLQHRRRGEASRILAASHLTEGALFFG
jgi:RNA polymerase sigma-32 factor